MLRSYLPDIVISTTFFILSSIIAIKVVPYFVVREIHKKNRKHIIRKVSSVIQEICDYLNKTPFKDEFLNQEQLAIFTTKKDIRSHRFIGLVNINVTKSVYSPALVLIILQKFKSLNIDDSYNLLTKEIERIRLFRGKLENIIGIHSLHIDDGTLLKISDVCLDIRSLEIEYDSNSAIDDLIEKGVTKRIGVFGTTELAKVYEKIVILLKDLIAEPHFDLEISIKENNLPSS